MELILLVGGLVLLDLFAMRFGVDSRIRDPRDRRGWWSDLSSTDAAHAPLQVDADVARLAMRVAPKRASVRIRLAHALRALALLIEPNAYARTFEVQRNGRVHSTADYRIVPRQPGH